MHSIVREKVIGQYYLKTIGVLARLVYEFRKKPKAQGSLPDQLYSGGDSLKHHLQIGS